MSYQARTNILAGVIAGLIVLSFSVSAFAADGINAVAAKKFARSESCLRCHNVSKKKEGPSYQSIAYKYKDRPEAADMLVKHITSGEDKVKLSDGHEETHKITRTKDMDQIRNLVNWILSQ